MRRTQDCAMKAAWKLVMNMDISEIEEEEISSLISVLEAELRERDLNERKSKNREFAEFMNLSTEHLTT